MHSPNDEAVDRIATRVPTAKSYFNQWLRSRSWAKQPKLKLNESLETIGSASWMLPLPNSEGNSAASDREKRRRENEKRKGRRSMEEDGLVFDDIFLATCGHTKLGLLNVHPRGISWKEHGHGESVEVDLFQISGLKWIQDIFCQCMLELEDGVFYRLIGFQEEDFTILNDFFQSKIEKMLKKTDHPVIKQNCVEVDANENILTFQVCPELALQVSVVDVEKTSAVNKPEALMQDAWLTMTTGCFPYPSIQISKGKIVSVVDENCSANSSVAIFKNLSVNGWQFHVELDCLSIQFYGGEESFEVAYADIIRLFSLPMVTKTGAFTLIVANLKEPFQYRRHYVPFLVMKFEIIEEAEVYLKRIEDLLGVDQREKLEASCKGLSYEAFSSILCALAGKEIAGPGSCCNSQGGYGFNSYIIKHKRVGSHGLLYPLEKDFFFLPSDPTFIAHEEIEYVEFRRLGVKGSRLYSAGFDLAIKLRNRREIAFSNIVMAEYEILLQFIRARGLKIRNGVDPGHIIYGSTAASEAGHKKHNRRVVAEKDGAGTVDSGEMELNTCEIDGDNEKPYRERAETEADDLKVSSGKKKFKNGH